MTHENAESATADETGKPADLTEQPPAASPETQGDAEQPREAEVQQGDHADAAPVRLNDAQFAELLEKLSAIVVAEVEALKQEIARLAGLNRAADVSMAEPAAPASLAGLVDGLHKRLTTLELKLRHF